ncbi:MAG: hypothetical protein ACREQW_25490, partial [Candidatus Binatia bacterium]
SAERKIINNIKSRPFVLSTVEGLREGFFTNLLVSSAQGFEFSQKADLSQSDKPAQSRPPQDKFVILGGVFDSAAAREVKKQWRIRHEPFGPTLA